MKGYNYWSYAPYRPLLTDVGDIYICRVAPGENSIHFEWLEGGNEFKIYLKKRSDKDFVFVGTTTDSQFDIENLETDTDY